jgi:plasmid stabilization system protein ParE
MIYNIEFSIYAFETYDSIAGQVEAKWGYKILNDFEQRVVDVLTKIQASPFIFQAIDNNHTIRKSVIHGNCSVFYEIKQTTVEILFFWDNRQDPIL